MIKRLLAILILAWIPPGITDTQTSGALQADSLRMERIWALLEVTFEFAEALAECNNWLAGDQRPGNPVLLSRILTARANALRELNRPLAAIPIHRQALEIRHQAGDAPAEVSSLQNLANCWLDANCPDSATQYLNQATELCKKRLLYAELDDLGETWGYFYQSKKKFARAAGYFQEALQQAGRASDVLRLQMALAALYLEWNKPSEAEPYLEQAFKSSNLTSLDSARLYRQSGVCKWQLRNYQNAVAQTKQALRLIESKPLTDTVFYAGCLQDLGDYFLQRGDFTAGVEVFRRAAALKGLPALEQISLLQRIALGFRFQGEPEVAGTVITEAINLSGKFLPDEARHVQMPILLLTLVGCSYETGDYAAALRYCREAWKYLPEPTADTRLLSAIGQKTGLCLLSMGKRKEALPAFREAYHAARKCQDRPLMFSAQYHLGECQLAEGQFDQAEASIRGAAAILGIRLDTLSVAQPFEHLLIENALLQIQVKQARQSDNPQQWQICHDKSMRVIALLESFKNDFRREESQLGLQHIFYEPYHCAAEACIQLKREEQAFRISQRYKSQFLKNLGSEDTAGSERPAVAPNEIAVDAIQARLQPGQTLLDYLWGEDRFMLFVIRSDTFATLQRSKTMATDSAIVRFFQRCSQNPQMPMKDSDRRLAPSELTQSGIQLYQILLKPVESLLKKNGSLTIIPDGALWYVPFEALIVNEKAKPETLAPQDWFTWEHEVQYMQNATRIAGTSKPGNTAFKHQLLAMAPAFEQADAKFQPLKHNMEEAEQACRLLGGMCNTGPAASIEVLKREAAHCRILLMATHGLLNNAEPGRSALVFSAEGSENGYDQLSTAEIDSMHISADLVLLSACQTARGKLFRGEGLASLARAFLSAGAGSVVATRWNADDVQTPVLVASFLENLATGMNQATALAAARKTYLERKGVPTHPFFWAGMMFSGDTRPMEGLMIQRGTMANMVGWGVIGLLVAAGIGLLLSRKKVPGIFRFWRTN